MKGREELWRLAVRRARVERWSVRLRLAEIRLRREVEWLHGAPGFGAGSRGGASGISSRSV